MISHLDSAYRRASEFRANRRELLLAFADEIPNQILRRISGYARDIASTILAFLRASHKDLARLESSLLDLLAKDL
jgi:hypothetical protein